MLINRKLQVYDYINEKLQFELEVANEIDTGTISDPRNCFFFMDNDNVIVL